MKEVSSSLRSAATRCTKCRRRYRENSRNDAGGAVTSEQQRPLLAKVC